MNWQYKSVFIGILLALLLAGGCRKKADMPAAGGQEEAAAVESMPMAAEKGVGPAWVTDLEAAKKIAAQDGKDLFINFTGSDWCGWCIRLDKEVFSHKEFVDEASKKFVFVMIDFPRNKSQSKELKAINDKLAKQYQVDGFPTIILADAGGKTYGVTGYEEGGPKAYLENLARMQADKGK